MILEFIFAKDEFVDSKSGLKAIQYMAFGIPTVASNVGNTPNIISNNKDGILVIKWNGD